MGGGAIQVLLLLNLAVNCHAAPNNKYIFGPHIGSSTSFFKSPYNDCDDTNKRFNGDLKPEHR